MEAEEYHALRAVEDTHWWFQSLHEHVVDCLRGACRGAGRRLLDAGCGTGGLAVRLAALGEVDAVDASPLAVQYCHERGLPSVRLADLNSFEPPAERYDAITCVDVLYHRDIQDESAVLRRLAGGLRPGGVLFLHLPAYESLRSRHDLRVHTRRRYRLGEVRRLIEQAGLVIEHVSYRVTLFFPAIVLFRLAGSLLGGLDRAAAAEASDVRRIPALLNHTLLAGCRLESRLSRRLRLPFGVSIWALARRPRGPEVLRPAIADSNEERRSGSVSHPGAGAPSSRARRQPTAESGRAAPARACCLTGGARRE